MKRRMASVIMISLFMAFVPIRWVHAQFLPFGGIVTVFIPCTANAPPATLIYIIPNGPFPPNQMFLFPGTIPYSYFAYFIPGNWILGSDLPVAIPCLVYVGVGFVPVGIGFPMYQVGSGLL